MKELTVFQVKHRKSAATTQGDSDLRNFIGVAGYFTGPEGIDSLLASSPNEELANLVKRLDVRSLLADAEFSVRLVFVTNADLDTAGADYENSRIGLSPQLDVWPRSRLAGVAERTQTLTIQNVPVSLSFASP